MIPEWMKPPCALVPPAMSLLALVLVVTNAAIFPSAKHSGSGAITWIFELLMSAQLPVILFLIVTRFRREPRPTLRILGVQASAAFAAFAFNWFLN
jgi:hypothetical protein